MGVISISKSASRRTRLKVQHDPAPLTDYIGDLILYQRGKLSAADIRERWRVGAYKGVRHDWAKDYAAHHGLKGE